MQLTELIAVLCEEAQIGRADVLASAEQLVTLDEEEQPEALEAAAEAYVDFCRRTGAASESLGLQGLNSLAAALADGVAMCSALPVELRAPAAPLLTAWPTFFVAYLQDWAHHVCDTAAIQRLITAVAAAEFVTPLDERQREELQALLAAPPSIETQQASMTTVWQPLPEDALSLAPADDADPAMVEGLLAEGPVMVQRLAEVVAQLADRGASPEQLELAHRLAHTLKGNAAIAGVRGLATMAHSLEDLLEAYRRPEFKPPQGLAGLMMAACDQLEFAFEGLSANSPRVESLAPTARALHAWASHLQGAEVPQELLTVAVAAPVSLEASPDLPAQTDPAAAAPGAEEEAQIRVQVGTMDRIFRAVNELSIGMLRMRRQQDDLVARMEALTSLEQTALHRLQEIENRVSLQGLGRSALTGAASPRVGLARSDQATDFDDLELDRYNELTGSAQALGEAILDLRSARQDLLPALREAVGLAQRQLGFAREAQYRMAQARLRPLSDLRTRLKRTVRQTCLSVGREATLEILGDEARVDAAVLGPLADALLHLLRNSVDHGIEPAAERVIAGKPAAGRLQLSFSSSGGGLVVRLSDDGRGLDLEAILDKAIDKGLVAPEAHLSPDQISRLIFLPGFSTRQSVSETSGRGVGLDVVAEAVAALQGSVSVQSVAGQGAEFRLFVLPTVGTIHALHVSLHNEHFLIPSVQLQSAVAATASGGDGVDQDGDLGQLLFGGAPAAGASRPCVLVEVDGLRHRLTVDRIVEAREFLISPAPNLIARMPGVSGTASLADGALAIVLDVHELVRKPLPVQSAGLRQLQGATARRHKILVVDDSASVRNTLGQLLRDTGYEVVTARDGLEAIRAVMETAFNAVLTDLEMPQVNGFELTEFIRQRSGQTGLPVVMLTSRGQSKHQARAAQVGVNEFLVKPYSDAQITAALGRAVAAGVTHSSIQVSRMHGSDAIVVGTLS